MPLTVTIGEILKKTPDLPSMPAAALNVMREADSETGSAVAVAKHISQDQALTARVLRLANSPYYGLPRQITDLQEAVVVLGMRCIRNLAVVAASYPWLSRPVSGYALEPKQLWKHSIGVAVGAQIVAKRTKACCADTAFTAGLLHNMGKIAVSIWLDNKLKALVAYAIQENMTFDQVERKVLGFDHADVGAHLAEQWNLPEVFVLAIQHHHNPDRCQPPNPIVDAVHLGDFMTMSMGYGLGGDGLRYDLYPSACERLGLSQDELDTALALFVEEYERQEQSFAEIAEGM
jgi:putative nucleotidyltransferase with HDIG domain